MAYGYFPGCSLKGTGRAYEESFLAICKSLNLEMEEIPDWNCCGATAYMSVDDISAYVLSARNLAIAVNKYESLVAPCNACYQVFLKTQNVMEKDSKIKELVTTALAEGNLKLPDSISIRHPIDVLYNDVGIKELKNHVINKLKGYKLAVYYGCQAVRPNCNYDNPRDPILLEEICEATGAETVYFPLKTKCCGGSLTGSMPDKGMALAKSLLDLALRNGAHAMVVCCPLCQFNLECYQERIYPAEKKILPVLYFTQVLGLAIGLSDEDLGLQRHLVSSPFLNLEKVES